MTNLRVYVFMCKQAEGRINGYQNPCTKIMEWKQDRERSSLCLIKFLSFACMRHVHGYVGLSWSAAFKCDFVPGLSPQFSNSFSEFLAKEWGVRAHAPSGSGIAQAIAKTLTTCFNPGSFSTARITGIPEIPLTCGMYLFGTNILEIVILLRRAHVARWPLAVAAFSRFFSYFPYLSFYKRSFMGFESYFLRY